MNKFLMIGALAALAACQQEAAEPAAEETVAAVEAVSSWPIEAGTYEYTRSDGVAGVNTLAEDGTYSNAVAGDEVETGTWGQEGDMSCLVPAEGDKRCYIFTEPDAEGNFTGTMANGVTAQIRKTA